MSFPHFGDLRLLPPRPMLERIGFGDMITEIQAQVTEAVGEAFGRTADPRLTRIPLALVEHVHRNFAARVR